MKKWVMTGIGYHSTNISTSNWWYRNIEAKTRNKAILEGYRILIRDLIHYNVKIPDISQILKEDKIQVKIVETDECYAFTLALYNQRDTRGRKNIRGVKIIEDSNNIDQRKWFEIEKRTDKNLYKALLAYRHDFRKLPVKTLTKMLKHLE